MTKYHRRILVVGHPRTGTAYTASLLGQLGIDVQHEGNGADGVSSWMMSVDDPENPWSRHPVASSRSLLTWDYCLHPVRDFADAIPSIMREDTYAPVSKDFRQRHILRLCDVDLSNCANEFEHAVQSLLCWTRIIHTTKPDLHFRIEDELGVLTDFLHSKGLGNGQAASALDPAPVNGNKLYKGKRYPKPDIGPENWHALPDDIWQGVLWYCKTFGYPTPLPENR